MPEEKPTSEVEARLDRIGEYVAELKGELRYVDACRPSINARPQSNKAAGPPKRHALGPLSGHHRHLDPHPG